MVELMKLRRDFFYNRSSRNNSVTRSSGFKPTSHLKLVNPDAVLHIIPSGEPKCTCSVFTITI
jgi:hypothetical protein